MSGYEREPRWFGDEDGLPPCRDPEHRHSGPCEFWQQPPVPWQDNVFQQITVGVWKPFQVTYTHRPTGLAVRVEGLNLHTAHELCATELGRLLDQWTPTTTTTDG